jgi:ABC-type cobalamin/Fe3+-siderophores transport system ATPase subunit
MNNSITLKKIKISGFKSENKIIDLDFSKEQTTIIFGINGSGKTTFLKILYAVLSKNDDILESEKVNSIELTYLINGKIKIINIEKNSKYKAEDFFEFIQKGKEIPRKYIWKNMDNSELSMTKSLSLGIERGITNRNNLKPQDILMALNHSRFRQNLFSKIEKMEFAREITRILSRRNKSINELYNEIDFLSNHVNLQNIELNNIENILLDKYKFAKNIASERIQNALFETISFIFEKDSNGDLNKKPNIDDVFTKKLLDSKNRIIEALDNNFEKNKFKEKIIEILKSVKTYSDINEKIDNKILYNLINNMINELEYEKQLLSSISLFIEHFNNFLNEDKKLILEQNQIYIEINGNNHYGMEVLSSGEKHIFTFLSLIIIEGNLRNFLFIDEPEISLNITWQRKIIDLLEKLAPNTQIIVASHSPMIANKRYNSLVELSPNKYNEFKELEMLEEQANNELLYRNFNV